MSAAPKVSVVTATYNMARYLPFAIESALSQDYDDFEIVLVDDGSTDETTEVIRQYGDRIRYFYQPNAGVARACNRAMELARGQYLQLLDADDTLLPGAIGRNVEAMDRHPSAALAYGEALVIDERGKVVGKRTAPGWIARAGLVPSEAAFRQLLHGCHITNSGVMLRSSVLETIPPFQPEAVPGEDWDLWMRIAAEHDLVYTPEPLACYRVHGQSITSTYTVAGVANSHFRSIDRIFANPEFRYKHLRSYAYACVERTVARVAARLRDRTQFTGYFADSLRRCPRLAFEGETFAVAAEGAKTLLPLPLIAAGRNVKRGLSLKREPAHD